MIKRFLISAAVITSVACLTNPAHAAEPFLVPGTDIQVVPSDTGPGLPIFDLSNALNWLQQLGLSSEQINQAIKLFNLTTTVETDLHHLTKANVLAAGLNDLRNSMPHTSVVPAAITGNGAFGSAADTWAAQFLDKNVIYQPTEHGADDWVAHRMETDASWLANSQGASAANLDNLESRVDVLADLQNCVDNSDTIQDESSCNSRLAAENAYQQNQAAQATNLLVLTNGQRDAAAQAQQQYTRKVLDTAGDDLCNALNSFGTTNVSTLCEVGGDAVPTAAVVANNGG